MSRGVRSQALRPDLLGRLADPAVGGLDRAREKLALGAQQVCEKRGTGRVLHGNAALGRQTGLDALGDGVVQIGEIPYLRQGVEQSGLGGQRLGGLAQRLGRKQVQPPFEHPVDVEAVEHVIHPRVGLESRGESVDEGANPVGVRLTAGIGLDTGDQGLGSAVVVQQRLPALLVTVVRGSQLVPRGAELDLTAERGTDDHQKERPDEDSSGVA